VTGCCVGVGLHRKAAKRGQRGREEGLGLRKEGCALCSWLRLYGEAPQGVGGGQQRCGSATWACASGAGGPSGASWHQRVASWY